jgi:hypothetical protein
MEVRMRFVTTLLAVCLLLAGGVAHADSVPLDCAKKSLSDTLNSLKDTSLPITFTGICAGPIVIRADGLTLMGVGTAVIDGGGADAVTIEGASRVTLVDVEIRNGGNGIVAREGAHITLTRVNSHDNAIAGIAVMSSSGAVGSGVTSSQNGAVGLLLDDGGSITLADSTLTGNTVRDLQLTFASRGDFRSIVFGTYSCDATVLVRGTAGLTCPH